MHRFLHRRRVEFADTDLAGIMHFSNFFRFMEVSEHAFYRELGFSVHDFRPEPGAPRIGWPRVHASADFRAPVCFEEEIEVELLIERIGGKSITLSISFLEAWPSFSCDGKVHRCLCRIWRGRDESDPNSRGDSPQNRGGPPGSFAPKR